MNGVGGVQMFPNANGCFQLCLRTEFSDCRESQIATNASRRQLRRQRSGTPAGAPTPHERTRKLRIIQITQVIQSLDGLIYRKPFVPAALEL